MGINLKCLLSTMLCMFFVSQASCQDKIQRIEDEVARLDVASADRDGGRNEEIENLINRRIAAGTADLIRDLKQLTDDVMGLVNFTRNLVPIGAIIEYPGNDILPANWLECDGRAVSRVDYAELFFKIGITYGGADGIHNFNLPDRRGRVAVGIGSDNSTGGRITNTAPHIALGKPFGEERHQLTENELPTHQHDMHLYDGTLYDTANPCNPINKETIPTLDYHFKKRTVCFSQRTEGPFRPNAPHSNMQPSIFMKFYIRAT